MVRKKIDNRIRTLIENGVKLGHRTLFFIVGKRSRDQVVILHHILSKACVKERPSVLWCYKKELGFNTHKKKQIKKVQNKIQLGKLTVNEDDPFELFISSTKIRYCYYSETQKILGNTYGLCVLQDFEALTPNILARTIETIEGGGLIILLLESVTSLKDICTIDMDVHQKFRTETHQDVVSRFNERLLLSLSTCKHCLVVDDELSVLPISSVNLNITAIDNTQELSQSEIDLNNLKNELKDTQPVGTLVDLCKTWDQSKALLKFIETISEKSLQATVSLTASRGRGKSAALGLAVSAAVAFGYSNIFVTSPSPENLCTFFDFVFKGFDSLGYQEHIDYSLVQSTNPEFNKAIVRVNIFRNHRQIIQYIHPTDNSKLSQAELLVIDEAAAIPLTNVKAMLGPYLIFLASTINGYEGTGRSLSLKLLSQLRKQSAGTSKTDIKNSAAENILHEVTLNESIRYKSGDPVETWLTKLLCLDSSYVTPILSGCPPPERCDLYYINRDTLFSYHKASEEFLQRLVALYVASHYKNSPNDLQILSDAPAHHLFCLLGPIDINQKALPEVLVVLQLCLEGGLSEKSATQGLSNNKKASGDLIPWTIGQQYQDTNFPKLAGARIVRIATHPDHQSMGYGSRALHLLKQYYQFEIHSYESQTTHENVDSLIMELGSTSSVEFIEPKRGLPPLLLKLTERPPEKLEYLGVSFGLTEELLKFWKRAEFVPVYLRQTTNELTGEHSCIMLNVLNRTLDETENHWLEAYWTDFRRRFIHLLSYQFKLFHPSLALGLLCNNSVKYTSKDLTRELLDIHLTKFDMRRLEMYSNNLVDYHLIMDLIPTLAELYFLYLKDAIRISALQVVILLGIGLQHKTIDNLKMELSLPSSQLLGLFNRLIRCYIHYLNRIVEDNFEKKLKSKKVNMVAVSEDIEHDLKTTARKIKKSQDKELKKLKREELSQFTIKGSYEEWDKTLLRTKEKNIISVKCDIHDEQILKPNNNRCEETTDTEMPIKKKRKSLKKADQHTFIIDT